MSSTNTIEVDNEIATNTFKIMRSRILNGELRISSKRGRSKVWELFGKVESVTGEELQDIVACRMCLNVYKYNGKTTSNLVRHKCYLEVNKTPKCTNKLVVDAETKKIACQLFTEWTVENCRPFKIVQDSGFQKMSEFLISVGARFGSNVDVQSVLPHPTTISRNIANIFDICYARIKNEISAATVFGFGLTSDLWTDNYLRRTYIALTIHYVKEGNFISRLLGMKSMDGEKCTSNVFNVYLLLVKKITLLFWFYIFF